MQLAPENTFEAYQWSPLSSCSEFDRSGCLCKTTTTVPDLCLMCTCSSGCKSIQCSSFIGNTLFFFFSWATLMDSRSLRNCLYLCVKTLLIMYQRGQHAVCVVARMLHCFSSCQNPSVLLPSLSEPPAVTSDLVPVLLQLGINLIQFVEPSENELF